MNSSYEWVHWDHMFRGVGASDSAGVLIYERRPALRRCLECSKTSSLVFETSRMRKTLQVVRRTLKMLKLGYYGVDSKPSLILLVSTRNYTAVPVFCLLRSTASSCTTPIEGIFYLLESCVNSCWEQPGGCFHFMRSHHSLFEHTCTASSALCF